jgi:hypothetical protein
VVTAAASVLLARWCPVSKTKCIRLTEEQIAALEWLAVELHYSGQRGTRLNAIIAAIADFADNAGPETEAALRIAHDCAGGMDWDMAVAIARPVWPLH